MTLFSYRQEEEPMSTQTLDEAQSHLRELVAGLQPGEEVVLTDNGLPVAKLVKSERTSWPCQAGSAKGKKHWMAPDFNVPLDEFKEYME
jgi:antitoxin (DNA-binding transcriptional repressor) of toxin-antitoxin stability system